MKCKSYGSQLHENVVTYLLEPGRMVILDIQHHKQLGQKSLQAVRPLIGDCYKNMAELPNINYSNRNTSLFVYKLSSDFSIMKYPLLSLKSL